MNRNGEHSSEQLFSCWAKALFEGALGHPVEVVAEQTIIKGDKQCKLKITL